MNPIIDKIKKLLRLGRCSAASPAEAALAMAKALALAAENGIDLSQVPTDDPERGGMTHETEPSQKGPAHRLAARLVKRHFSVDTLFDSTGEKAVIHFIGIETNCQLARYCYVYLVRASRTAWRKRTNRRLRDRESFLRGYFAAIDSLMPATFHREGLVVSSAGYIEGVILAGKSGVILKQTTPKPQRVSESAFFHGLKAGDAAGIHNAVRGTDKPLIS